jgi:DNA repair photolyase
MGKAKRLIDEIKTYEKAVIKKSYVSDIYKLKCHQCGRTIPAEDAEWIAVGTSSDPYRPFCPECASKDKVEG